jgi:hypothetical protein
VAGAIPLGVKVGSVSTVDVMKYFRQIAYAPECNVDSLLLAISAPMYIVLFACKKNNIGPNPATFSEILARILRA